MSGIAKFTEGLRDSIPEFNDINSVNERISNIRELSNYKSVVFLLRNSDLAKTYLEETFLNNKQNKELDMFLFSIILAFIDINDLKYSSKLSKFFSKVSKELHWTSVLAKSHLLYLSLYTEELNYGK